MRYIAAFASIEKQTVLQQNGAEFDTLIAISSLYYKQQSTTENRTADQQLFIKARDYEKNKENCVTFLFYVGLLFQLGACTLYSLNKEIAGMTVITENECVMTVCVRFGSL